MTGTNTIPSWIDGKWTILKQLHACIDKIEEILVHIPELIDINERLETIENNMTTLYKHTVTTSLLPSSPFIIISKSSTPITLLSGFVNTDHISIVRQYGEPSSINPVFVFNATNDELVEIESYNNEIRFNKILMSGATFTDVVTKF